MKHRISISIFIVAVTTLIVIFQLNTNTLFGRWAIWRAPTIKSFENFPTVELANIPENLFSFPVKDTPTAISSYAVEGTNLEEFLTDNDTTAFIVIKDDELWFEKYLNGAQRNSQFSSFSVTKSFISALLGIAIDQGHISSVMDLVSKYVPELSEHLGSVTIEHLLRMSSGVQFSETEIFGGIPAWWSDEYKASFSPDMRSTIFNLKTDKPPLTQFKYNNFNPAIIALIIERTTDTPIYEFARVHLWNKLGFEYNASWTVDNTEHKFANAESGLNLRAIDMAKFGQLFLNDGAWQGNQVISQQWINASTTQNNVLLEEKNRKYVQQNELSQEIEDVILSWRYYFFWWGIERDDHSAIFANGHLGQFIYIVPKKKLVIVRTGYSHGEDKGDDEWLKFLYEFSEAISSTH